MIRWGIIGAGKIAKRFAQSLAYEEDAVLYAISGRNPEKMKQFQVEHPCQKVYLDHHDLLADPAVDAVYIALPHDMHAAWALEAIQMHKAVLCEKPAVLNADEMKEIITAARRENILFMEAMKSRFEPAYLRTKELLEKNKIGSLLSIKAQISSAFPIEQNPDSYIIKPGVGGALLDTGCYCVNWLNDLCKEELSVKNISAVIKNSIDYYVDASLMFGNVECEVIAGIDRKLEPITEIVGTKGEILVEKPHRPEIIHIQLNGEKEKVEQIPYVHDDFYGQIHHFDTLLKDGRKESDVMSLADSLRNAQIIDMIKKAVEGE